LDVGLLEPIRDFIDALVHPSARDDALMRRRHRAFMAPRLLGSLCALAAFPVYLVMRGVPSALEVVAIVWLIAPLSCAYFLSRTGHYEGAHMLSSISLTFLIAVVAAQTGGTASFAAIWLVVVPLEAALSASRRVVAVASAVAMAACALLIMLGILRWLPGEDVGAGGSTLAALGIASATLYATGLALGAESLARAGNSMLDAEEHRYQLLSRHASDVITRHGRNGATLFASPAAESLFGAKPSELHGHGLFDRIHVLDRPAYLTALSDAAATGNERSVAFRVKRDGPDPSMPAPPSYVWIEMQCRPLARSAGHDWGEVVAVMRDGTERKAQEQAIEEARADCERANAIKSRFLATMSHELRTPLNVIIGFSDMLLNEAALSLDADRRRDYAKLISDSGTHLLAVVNGILDMSRLDSGEFEIRPEPFALAAVIEHCCDLLALRLRDAGLDISINVPRDLPEVVADKRAVKQILINLLSNAVKFTDRGGRVTVSATTDGPTLTIAVEDNGIGIEEEDLPRLGDPFFQARSAYDRRHDGTGLGLSIVKGLAALHGGALTIRSRVGEGTQVAVRLPLDGERARQINLGSTEERWARSAQPLSSFASEGVNQPARKRA
jgi:cell cycle sensor histidine kinase DivJ